MHCTQFMIFWVIFPFHFQLFYTCHMYICQYGYTIMSYVYMSIWLYNHVICIYVNMAIQSCHMYICQYGYTIMSYVYMSIWLYNHVICIYVNMAIQSCHVYMSIWLYNHVICIYVKSKQTYNFTTKFCIMINNVEGNL